MFTRYSHDRKWRSRGLNPEGSLTADHADITDGTEEGWSKSLDNNIEARNIRPRAQARAHISVPILLS